MALESLMAPLGSPLPTVTLPDLDGAPVDLIGWAAGRPLVVLFACNHCPYVRHVEQMIGELSSETSPDVAWVAIASNDADSYPDDDLPGLREQSRRAGWDFPYLIDSEQTVARTFHAACTPDFFLYDGSGALAYRGALDDATPKNGRPVTGELLRDAIGRVVAGRDVPEPHRPSMGCGIKWKPGNEPI